jgi:hypothetical protein
MIHTNQGEDLELVCNYDLEGDKLYSVKWYRNAQEFYRYIPTDNPSTAVFRQPGLIVNEYRSSETNIFLRMVDLMTTGLFRYSSKKINRGGTGQVNIKGLSHEIDFDKNLQN